MWGPAKAGFFVGKTYRKLSISCHEQGNLSQFVMITIRKPLLASLLIGTALLSGTVSHAASSAIDPAVAEKAVKLAKRVHSGNLIAALDEARFENKLATLTPEEKVNYLRRTTMDALSLRNQLSHSDLVSAYNEAAQRSNNQREIALSELFALYYEHSDTGGQFTDFESFRIKLTPYLESQDWFVSHRAKVFLATAESFTLDLNTALSNALEALNEIPNEQSPYVDEAVIESLDLIAYLHNLLNNPELAVTATEDLINRRLEKGYEIDGISLINNLIYSFGKWQDFDTTSELAKVLVDLDGGKTGSVLGLSQLRLAQTLNDKSDYQGALAAIDSTISSVEHKGVRANLLINRTVALAGLGRVKEAEKAMAAYEAFKTQINLNSNNLESRELMAEALLAQARGDMTTAFTKMRERFTIIVQRNLVSNNANTTKLLANLENSKERQAERENSLIREAELKQAKLEQQQRVNQLLMILAGFLGISVIFAVAFARYRDKISKELAIKTEEALSADKQKSEFLGMISHELRTPLNGIIGIADLLSTQGPTEDVRKKTGIILDSGHVLCDVVESIVDMSAIDSNKLTLYPEETDIVHMVKDLEHDWRPVIEKKDIIFTTHVDAILAEGPTLDAGRYRQCLKNLLSNAAKFTEKGRIHLHVTAAPVDGTDEIEITAVVADTGMGMSEDVQGKLFTPFLQADSSMTRKFGGSGLGLAITRSIARMMGGDVTLDSKQNRGSIFTLKVQVPKSQNSLVMDELSSLLDTAGGAMPVRKDASLEPISIEETPEIEALPPAQVSHSEVPTIDIEVPVVDVPIIKTEATPRNYKDLRGLKVLIVEDMPSNQDVIKLFLEPQGCEMLCASNGREALNTLRTQTVDIILMDIRMPDMNGIEATRAIRSQRDANQHVPIIALTADAAAETNAECMAAGADIFLTKPVMAKDLIDAIRFLRHLGHDDASETVSETARRQSA